MPEPRSITLKLSTILTIIGMLCGAVGGYLIRRDIQVVTQATLARDVSDLKMESARTNAYVRSMHLWAVRLSVRNGWPEPPAPERFLEQSDIMITPGLIPNAMAQESP